MASSNPFSPTFGASPPTLAGRDEILDDIADALDTGPSHPDYTVLFVGVRGSGKTVMLNAVEDLARARGWLTVSDNASPDGLLDRLARAIERLVVDTDDRDPKRRVTGVSAAGFGIDVEHVDPPEGPSDLRSVLTAIGQDLAQREVGLLITLDELQGGSMDELRDFGAVLQHVTRREQLPIAFAGASLPQIDDTLLSDDDIATFLQRCSRYDIDRLDDRATAEAIATPIADRGGALAGGQLEVAVRATSGYAFMIQLVGFYVWRRAEDPGAGITDDELASGIEEAERRIGRLIFAPTWKGLSDVDRRFLLAMARDDEPSRLATVAHRLDVDTNYAGVYRHRLISSGMIAAAGHGKVDFAHHATRDWLRNEAAYAAILFPDDEA